MAQPAATTIIDPECMAIRRRNFGDDIVFHAPGLQRYATSEYAVHDAQEFVSISVTGEKCALSCEHCQMQVLRGMTDLTATEGTLYDLCARAKDRGSKGVLISGGSDREGMVPLLPHMDDLIRVRRELGLVVRVHPGLPDEETCAGLAEADIDGAMVDIIGHDDTIREVYHLDHTIEDYAALLERLDRHRVPMVPHIVLGLHFGKILGELQAIDMIAKHPPKLLVLVVLMPLNATPMASVEPPPVDDVAPVFEHARKQLPQRPVMLGCARPLGELKIAIDRAAIDSGLNGIAYPADGMVAYAQERGLDVRFINACCGVTW